LSAWLPQTAKCGWFANWHNCFCGFCLSFFQWWSHIASCWTLMIKPSANLLKCVLNFSPGFTFLSLIESSVLGAFHFASMSVKSAVVAMSTTDLLLELIRDWVRIRQFWKIKGLWCLLWCTRQSPDHKKSSLWVKMEVFLVECHWQIWGLLIACHGSPGFSRWKHASASLSTNSLNLVLNLAMSSWSSFCWMLQFHHRLCVGHASCSSNKHDLVLERTQGPIIRSTCQLDLHQHVVRPISLGSITFCHIQHLKLNDVEDVQSLTCLDSVQCYFELLLVDFWRSGRKLSLLV